MKKALIVFAILFALSASMLSCKTVEKSSHINDNSKQSETDEGLNSIDDKEGYIQLAIQLGIADESLLLQLDEIASQKVVAQLLKSINDLYYGEGNSEYLSEMVELARPDLNASRYFVAQSIFYSRYEEVLSDVEYENSYKWFRYCDYNWHDGIEADAGYITRLPDGTVGELYEAIDINDFEKIVFSDSPDDVYPFDFGNPDAVLLAIKLYDRETGEKILTLDDENNFNPQGTLTVKEAIELSVRYYRSFPKHPVEVKYEDVGTYNKDIISDELLNKETDLPDCSNASLPKDWHGVLVGVMTHTSKKALAAAPDDIITEPEIETIKEAGFNYMGVLISFSSLQEPFFNKGTVNLSQLEYMDEVLSWCIKNDIHMEIRCNTPPGLNDLDDFEYAQNYKDMVLIDDEVRQEFSDFWGMLARRYDEIPNKYLSFNLICEPYILSDEEYLFGYKPIVDSIREVSPDRCIIADIPGWGTTGSKLAELGVALSWHQYDPREFCVLYEGVSEYSEGYLESVKWPYTDSKGKTWGVDAVFNEPMFSNPGDMTLLEAKAMADEYGVGFMVGEWGVFGAPSGTILTETYDREVLYGYYEDFVKAYEELGVGWVGSNFYAEYGITCPYPAVEEGCEYIPLEGTNLYKELNMIEFFQGVLNN